MNKNNSYYFWFVFFSRHYHVESVKREETIIAYRLSSTIHVLIDV